MEICYQIRNWSTKYGFLLPNKELTCSWTQTNKKNEDTVYVNVLQDGQPSRSIKDFQEPEGWRWQSSSWKVDADRAVDAEGWEYCISEGFGGIYVKAAKAIHMTRRRRWVRTRELMDLTEKRKKVSNRSDVKYVSKSCYIKLMVRHGTTKHKIKVFLFLFYNAEYEHLPPFAWLRDQTRPNCD